MVQWSLSKQITIDFQDVWYRSIDQDSNALSFSNAFILLDFHLFIKLSQILPWPRLSWREFTDLLDTRELVCINWIDIKTLEFYVITQHAHRNLQQGLYEIVSFKSPIFILFLKTWSLHLWPWHEPLRDTSSITCTDFRWSQLTAWGSSCSFQRSTMSWLWSSSRQHCLFSDVECLHSFIYHFYCCFNLCKFHMIWRNLSYDFLTLHGNMIIFLHNHLCESSTQMSIETNWIF